MSIDSPSYEPPPPTMSPALPSPELSKTALGGYAVENSQNSQGKWQFLDGLLVLLNGYGQNLGDIRFEYAWKEGCRCLWPATSSLCQAVIGTDTGVRRAFLRSNRILLPVHASSPILRPLRYTNGSGNFGYLKLALALVDPSWRPACIHALALLPEHFAVLSALSWLIKATHTWSRPPKQGSCVTGPRFHCIIPKREHN